MPKNRLFYGDNLPVLRDHIASESVDLVYLDPPFNSNRKYSVIFGNDTAADDATAQVEAFDDTWHWTNSTEALFRDILMSAPEKVSDAMQAFRTLVGTNDALAYLTMMAPRLVELHRVLRKNGMLYLHCDPTMSHYLKVLLDAIFGPEFFRNEIIWKRTSAHNKASRFGPVHDVILGYAKGPKPTWNAVYQPYDQEYLEAEYTGVAPDGRRYTTADLTSANPGSLYKWNGQGPPGKRYWGVAETTMQELSDAGRLHYTRNGITRKINYADDMPWMKAMDVWTDIPPISSKAAERLGYPTQKPLRLMERLIEASTNPGDVVLDPFCGCGTTVDASQKLGRQWVGIDITYLSVDLIVKRLVHTFGASVMNDVDVDGIPYDYQSAARLFEKSPFDFERWAVSMLHAQPNERQVGDKGIDGVRRFMLDGTSVGKALVSVKGGKNVLPTFVRDLEGTVHATADAHLGVLVTLNDKLSKGSQEVIDQSGIWTHPANGETFPVLQHVSVRQLLARDLPRLPGALAPYISAKRLVHQPEENVLFPELRR